MEAVLIIGLAAWRLASLFSNEDGPFDVFAKLRDRLIPEGQITPIQVQIFKALQCMWCMTVWTAAILYFVWLLFPFLVVILAAMTVAVIAEEYINAGKHQD